MRPDPDRTAGPFLRRHRERLCTNNPSFSLRKVAGRVGIQPSYLSKVEREHVPPPGEEVLIRLAGDLGIHPDLLLAMAGRVASEVQALIRRRPILLGAVVRELAEQPDESLLGLLRELRNDERTPNG